MKKISKEKRIRLVLFLLIVVWMMIVYSLSNQNGTESGGLSSKIAAWFTSDETKLEIVEHLIRKLAHLSEYAVGRNVIYIIFFYI